jgi:5-methylcytosine-specific restriction endonuclease McrA
MAQIDELILKYDYKCCYCSREIRWGSPKDPLHPTRDHSIPATRGGGRGDNLVLACTACNAAKGDMTAEEFTSFRETRKLPASYVKYLEEKLFRLMHRKPITPITVRARSQIPPNIDL